MNIIKIKNCDVFLGEKKVLENFSLVLDEHEHLAIVGPNGSGKSTLIRLLTKEIYPAFNQNSEIEVLKRDDWNIFELRHEIIAVSANFSESLLLASPLSVFDAVISAFFGTYGIFADQKITEKEIAKTDETLKNLELFELKSQMIHELSTGQLRKVLIARAMILQPKIILLDEPTSGLDIAASADFVNFLRKILNYSTIILVTHHLEEIMPEIKNILLLKEGEIFRYGKKEEILNSENLSGLFGAKIETHVSSDGIYRMTRLV